MKNLIALFLSTSLLIAGSAALADKMDSETQSDVIARLDRVLSKMEKDEAPWAATNLRLADLLAERARLRFMNEVEANCKGCKGSDADRRRAIGLYEGVVDRVRKEERGKVFVQLAHLYDTAGEQNKSSSLFEKILKAPKGAYDKELVTHARTGLADIEFQKNHHKKALDLYNEALKDPQVPNRGLIIYRVAWCEFNLGKLVQGTKTLEKLLKSPELLTRESSTGPVYDPAFNGDVLRDLATFYSRKPITASEIAKYKSMIPKGQEKELLQSFAGEADRIGQKQAAYQIFQSYLDQPGLSQEERLDTFIRLAQIKYDMGQSNQSTDDFAVAAMKYKENKCTDEARCADLQKRMKRYVTELHRSKKVKPGMDVLKAYFIYVKTFPQDTEMAILGAQIAIDNKQDVMALTMYHEAADNNVDPKFRELALLGEIDAAERMKDPTARLVAYQHYLTLMPQGSKAFEVRYQMAQVSYERKEWAQAAEAFRVLALDSSGSMELRKKSADLALDCLAIQKRDADIEAWSSQFASAMPASANEYRQVSRKALINQAAQTANDDKSSNSDLRLALQKMQTTDLRGASDSEKTLHFKNEAVLAQKSGDDVAFIAALNGLLTVKSLSANDREETLARKVGYYEKKLDFYTALGLARQMKFPKLNQAERALRLGTLTDLAGLNPVAHYQASLKAGLKGSQALSIRSRLVLLSSNPLKELKKQKELRKDTALMSDTLLLVYARTKDLKGVSPFLKDSRLAKTNAGRFIRKQPFYAQQAAVDRRLQGEKIRARNDTALGKSIKERVKSLRDADQQLKEAIALGDYTAQIMALTTVARENDRLTRELLTLPLPKKLSAAQQQQYVGLLKEQAKPFFAKSKIAQQKLNEFWSNETALGGLLKDFGTSRPELKPLLAQEIRLLAARAPSDSVRSRLEDSLKEKLPSAQELAAAREAVRRNPDSAADVEKLKSLETKMGHPLMSSYLETRLGQIHRAEI